MAHQNKYDKKHLNNLSAYERQVDRIYRQVIAKVVAIGIEIPDLKPDKLFSFDDYPVIRKRVEKLLSGMQSGLSAIILNGIESEWTLANNKNNELSRQVFGDNIGKLTQEQYKRYFSTNDNARKAFTKRKVNGLNLSDRVWRYTDQFKAEIELGLDVGIRSGTSATDMTHELRDYLRNPDKLFRRVRDEHGVLQLSKRAAAFHPGQGVYRSSYKNARRLAATETNIAYRTADYERWQQLDFVVGIEIKLSNNHPVCDICDDLKGRYPKDFKFTGWHPHCRCHAITILKTDEEIAEDTQRILDGKPLNGNSANRVDDVPAEFKKWLSDNEGRISKAKSLPYFMRDNEQYCQQAHITKTAAKGVKEAQALNTKLHELASPEPISQPKQSGQKTQDHVSKKELEVQQQVGEWLSTCPDDDIADFYNEIKDTLPKDIKGDFGKIKTEVMKKYFAKSTESIESKIQVPPKPVTINKSKAPVVTPANKVKTAHASPANKPVMSQKQAGEFVDYNITEGDNALFDITGYNWLKLSTQERKALFTYTTGEYQKINNALRMGENNNTAKIIHKALEKQSLPNDLILRRGEGINALARFGIEPQSIGEIIKNKALSDTKKKVLLNNMLTSKIGTEKGFLSTSFGNEQFGGDLTLEISVPKGTQAMYTSPFSDFGGYGTKWDGKKRLMDLTQTENEVLINSGCRMRITGMDIVLKKYAGRPPRKEYILKIDLIP